MSNLFKRIFTSEKKGKEPSNNKETLKVLKDQHATVSEIQKNQDKIMKEHFKKMGELKHKHAQTVKAHKERLETHRQTAKMHPVKKSKSPTNKQKSPDELALIDEFDNDQKKSISPDTLLRNEFDEVKTKSISPSTSLMQEMMLIDEFDSKRKSKSRSPKKGGKTMKKRGKK